MKRRVEIEVETERVTIRRKTEDSPIHRCPYCDAEVKVLSAHKVALLCDLTLVQFIGRIEVYGLHSIETATGLLYICLNSLRSAIRMSRDAASDCSTEPEATSAERPNLLKE